MPSYVVETYLARTRADERVACERRARSAAAEHGRQGRRISFVGALHIPDDEICFFLFDAGSSGDVAHVARRAGLEPLRVVEAIPSRKERDR